MTRKQVWLCVTAFLLVLGTGLWATLAMAAPSSQSRISPAAATIAVTSTGDAHDANTGDGTCDDGTGNCTLRAAIEQAASGDTITVPAGTYTLTLGSELAIDKSLTLTGAGSGDTIIQAATSSADATSRVFNITGGSVAISDVAVQNGNTAGVGGGIYNEDSGTVKISNSTVSGNTARSAGGGIVNSRGALTLINSTVSGNTARSGGGGGIVNSRGALNLINSTVSGNTAGDSGGGINHFLGVLTMTNSTISDNTAGAGGGIRNFGTGNVIDSTISGNSASGGGGIYNDSGTLNINNGTVSGNSARSGGGIYNRGTLSLTNSTITGNVADTGSGGGIRHVSGTAELDNAIIAENTAATGPDCSGTLTSLGYNLIGDDTDCGFAPVTGDLVNVDPLLAPLQDNGGPSFTHALLPGSPAINHIPVEDCEVTTDQRGVARPQGAACDIGAFEFRVPGDANGDWVVDMVDLRFVTAAMGTSNLMADLNGDRVVDIRDLALVALNLGREGP